MSREERIWRYTKAVRALDMWKPVAKIHLANSVHMKLTCKVLGHATITLTLDTYSHVVPSMHGDAAAAIDAVLSA